MKRNKANRIRRIIIILGICDVMLLGFFMFKGPKSKDSLGVSLNSNYIGIKLQNGVTYVQEFKAELNGLHEVSFLTRRSEQELSGTMSIELQDMNHNVIAALDYDAEAIVDKQLMRMESTRWIDNSAGQTYRLIIKVKNFKGQAELLGVYNANGVIQNGDKKPYSLVYYYTGVKMNKTYLWYPLMAGAVLLALYIILPGGKKDEKI